MSSIGDCGDSTNELLYLAVVEVPKRFPANDFQGNINAREEGAVSTGITFMRHSYQRQCYARCFFFPIMLPPVLFCLFYLFLNFSFSLWLGLKTPEQLTD